MREKQLSIRLHSFKMCYSEIEELEKMSQVLFFEALFLVVMKGDSSVPVTEHHDLPAQLIPKISNKVRACPWKLKPKFVRRIDTKKLSV